MSRVLFGITIVGLVLTLNLAWAEENRSHNPFGDVKSVSHEKTDKASPAPTPTTVSARQKIEAALDSKLKAPLMFEDTPLDDILNTLQLDFEIPILFDNSALDELAISPETEISINLRNISLRSALNLMFRQPGTEDLTYIIDEEVLLITTEERANETLQVRLYRVDDFPFYGDSGSNPPFHDLRKVLTTCVAYDSWEVHGTGEGSLWLMEPGILVVSQTQAVQHEIENLLNKIRQMREQITNQGQASSAGD